MNQYLALTLKILFILIAVPIAGGLLTGIDRKITARMQGRVGPPILQPFYDMFKLMQKVSTTVNMTTRYYVTISLVFAIFTTVVFCLGYDILIAVFALSLSAVFYVLAAYSSSSPYSLIGAERELLQIMAYEPMVLIVAFAFYYATGSFNIDVVFTLEKPLILYLPFVFLGLLYILTFKLRKSPFDISTSHHGHQEIVKGITTELTGSCMAMVEVMHWYETIFAIGLVFIFFVTSNPLSLIWGVLACILIYLFEIFADNAFARVKWEAALKMTWLVTSIAGFVNLFALSFFN